MFNKKLLAAAVIVFFASFFTLAQDKDTVIVEGEEGVNDTIIINDDQWENDESWDNDSSGDEWNNDWSNDDWKDEVNKDFKDWHWDFDWFGEKHGIPTISATYGFSQIDRHNFSSNFAEPKSVEAKLGYTSEHSLFENVIGKSNYSFFRLSNISTKLANKDYAINDLQSSLWRFGFGRESGYSWNFGRSGILPYHSYSCDWSRLEMRDFPAREIRFENGMTETDVLNRYNKAFRFGTSTEGGIKFNVFAGINLEASYERTIIFERHLFWKWAGSTVIEMAGHELLDKFVEEVGDASPFVVPVVNFVLKNAFSYGLYELRSEKMNWPFNSAAPLMYDQFKAGITFVF